MGKFLRRNLHNRGQHNRRPGVINQNKWKIFWQLGLSINKWGIFQKLNFQTIWRDTLAWFGDNSPTNERNSTFPGRNMRGKRKIELLLKITWSRKTTNLILANSKSSTAAIIIINWSCSKWSTSPPRRPWTRDQTCRTPFNNTLD